MKALKAALRKTRYNGGIYIFFEAIMAITPRKDTYVYTKEKLDDAQAYQSNQTPIRVMEGVFEEVGGDSGKALPPIRTPRAKAPPVASGMMFHDDAMNTLDDAMNTLDDAIKPADKLPLTAALLMQSKGQQNSWQLKPKGPASQVEKKFNAFLKALAAQKGCSVESLKQQGFQCESKGEKGTQVNFPNKDMAKLFSQMLNENTSAHQLLSAKPVALEDDEQRPSSRPSFRP